MTPTLSSDCPYCGSIDTEETGGYPEELVPRREQAWRCRKCRRVFRKKVKE